MALIYLGSKKVALTGQSLTVTRAATDARAVKVRTMLPTVSARVDGNVLTARVRAGLQRPGVRIVGYGAGRVRSGLSQAQPFGIGFQLVPRYVSIELPAARGELTGNLLNAVKAIVFKGLVKSDLPQVGAQVRVAQPTMAAVRSPLGQVGLKGTIDIPIATFGAIGFGALKTSGRLFFPPIQASGRMGFGPLKTSGLFLIPVRAKSRMSFGPLTTRGLVQESRNVSGQIGFGALKVSGAVTVYPSVRVTGGPGFGAFKVTGKISLGDRPPKPEGSQTGMAPSAVSVVGFTVGGGIFFGYDEFFIG